MQTGWIFSIVYRKVEFINFIFSFWTTIKYSFQCMAFYHQFEDIVAQREVFPHFLLSYSMLDKKLTLRRYKTNSVKFKTKTALHGWFNRPRQQEIKISSIWWTDSDASTDIKLRISFWGGRGWTAGQMDKNPSVKAWAQILKIITCLDISIFVECRIVQT